ncbi:TAT-binding protein-like protein 7, AAA ATPase [Linderina pennispora]|nr:TAT-binding protein-like protein 7, AAA ATPase [Linderina pennispora]
MSKRRHSDSASSAAYEDSDGESKQDQVTETSSNESEFQKPPLTRRRRTLRIADSAEDELSGTFLHRRPMRISGQGKRTVHGISSDNSDHESSKKSGPAPVVLVTGPNTTPVKNRLRKRRAVNYSLSLKSQSDDERKWKRRRRGRQGTYNLRQRSKVSYQMEPVAEKPPQQYEEFMRNMRDLRRAAEEKDALSDIDESESSKGNDGGDQILPMNLAELGVERCRKAGYLGAVGTPTADATSFEDVGGLEEHVRGLKEMVMLPLVYPDLCETLGIRAPRGVLFHGPPGTGKTLLARALASGKAGGPPIAFFMRRGGDVLSKWVGEGERTLRKLFAQARAFQPSIIFFDELDGLAPVRSARQDQAHASIVTTLLALMDGIEDRGQVVVIGATNRPDAIDPALRRPGRFDREMLFRLPGLTARHRILQIHTRKWPRQLAEDELAVLTDLTQGWGGADIQALCTEAALRALRRRYPTLYESAQRLQISADVINVSMTDLRLAAAQIVPSSQRSATSSAMPLPQPLQPLLGQLVGIAALKLSTALALGSSAPNVFRPRLAVHGAAGMASASVGAAAAYAMEARDVPVFHVTPALLHDIAGVGHLFQEALRRQPSVLHVPMADGLALTMDAAAIAMLDHCIRALPIGARVAVLVDVEAGDWRSAPEFVQRWFHGMSQTCFLKISAPERVDRTNFFQTLATHAPQAPAPEPTSDPNELPADPIPAPAPVNMRLVQRQLKRALLEVIRAVSENRLLRMFAEPPDPQLHARFYETTQDPACLSTVKLRASAYQYKTTEAFLLDIAKIANDWVKYAELVKRHPEDAQNRAQFLRELTRKLVRKHVPENLIELAREASQPRQAERKPPISNMMRAQRPAVRRPVSATPTLDSRGIPVVTHGVRVPIDTLVPEIVQATAGCSVESLEQLRVRLINEINNCDARGRLHMANDALRRCLRIWREERST